MNCYKLNEAIYNKCERILEGRQAEKSTSDRGFFKAIYGPGTLMNDWYEKRLGKDAEITPSEPPLSENMDSYRFPCNPSLPDRGEYFVKVFEGYGLGQELLLDHSGFSYYENYVTSYDLMYNHLKKGICGPFPRSYFKGQYLPETDLTNIFGNLTQWGLKEKVYEKMKHTGCREKPPESETTAEEQFIEQIFQNFWFYYTPDKDKQRPYDSTIKGIVNFQKGLKKQLKLAKLSKVLQRTETPVTDK